MSAIIVEETGTAEKEGPSMNVEQSGPSTSNASGCCPRPVEMNTPSVKKQRHSREIDTIHRDVLVTEKKKLEFEMELMKLKMQKVRSEIELLEMRKNSFQSSSYLSLSHFSEI